MDACWQNLWFNEPTCARLLNFFNPYFCLITLRVWKWDVWSDEAWKPPSMAVIHISRARAGPWFHEWGKFANWKDVHLARGSGAKSRKWDGSRCLGWQMITFDFAPLASGMGAKNDSRKAAVSSACQSVCVCYSAPVRVGRKRGQKTPDKET